MTTTPYKAGQPAIFFATAPKHIPELLAYELTALGAEIVSVKAAGVTFRGDLSVAYRACLGSRLANRILLPLATLPAPDPQALYFGVQQIDWSQHLLPAQTLAVDFSSQQSAITHTQFGAQKVKDAIVDQLRAMFGERPTVQLHQPDVMVNVYVFQDQATISIDLAGESLHKRGYRTGSGEAPLKENLAAAILLRAGWQEIAAQGGALVDVMCGIGTLPIEAALIAGNIAPGLLRDYFGFMRWRGHQPELWQQLRGEAQQQQRIIRSPIVGYDADPQAIAAGLKHVERAGLSGKIHLEKRELAALQPTQAWREHPGLVIANPPYGERLGEEEALTYLYKNLGQQFKTHFIGWQGAVFTGNTELGKCMGLRARKHYALFNGPIACRLLLFAIEQEYFVNKKAANIAAPALTLAADDPVHAFINRVKKNAQHLQRWVMREHINCYRIYDADLPEYAVAIDRYADWLHVQEYAPPKRIDPQKAEQRLQAIMQVLPAILAIPQRQIVYKVRRKQTRTQQYERLAEQHALLTVNENDAQFLVNLTDYLDTGLFLDQRNVRAEIKQLAKGKHFLNLFAYTATASVYAALGGAASTTSVDLSATYLQWAKKNFALNGLAEQRHHFIQADCLTWLQQEKKQYDLVFVAPPVFSRSKRMQNTFDIQRDHVSLLRALKMRLAPGGKIIFATHKKGFQLDASLAQDFQLDSWHKKMLPPDFQRSASVFHCWLLHN